MKKNKMLFSALILILFCAGCADSRQSGAEKPVEAFYNAIVSQDRERISAISCADWEKDALREVDAFMGVKTELKDFSCSAADVTEDSATVTCSGKIAASYGAEITDFPLEGRLHQVVKEQGEWRICGY